MNRSRRAEPHPPGGSSIVNRIDVRRHQGLVYRQALKIWRRWGCRPRGGVELEDLVAAGNEGLLHGAERFDHSLGFAQSTYLNWWIRHGISRCVDNETRAVRVPVHWLEKARKGLAAMPLSALSLDRPVGDEDGRTFGDLLPDTAANDPLAAIEHAETLDQVRAAVGRLPPRLATVIRARFWRDRTLKDIGESELGNVSRERARQLESEALEALGRALAITRRISPRRRRDGLGVRE